MPLIDLRSPAIYASLEDIYKEFSGGNIDPMAIRTFLQWAQENWISPSPIHLEKQYNFAQHWESFSNQKSAKEKLIPTKHMEV